MQCKKLGLIPYPAHTNFMNIRLPKKWDAGKLQEFSRANGILFKSGRSSGCFDNCIRVTLGPKIYMAKFVILLKKFMENTYGNE
jgi:histidinol-phosphate/aromatic aminotransferase/cobyric acid decarboxylase-like protein